ncbi:MAG: hypothetical protein KAX49_18090 [Halanaerobiales bacterium]|nr:hypothetical protein [Halanaerobiales bacterium]
MNIAKTFDEIFEQLHHLFQGEWIEIEVKKDGLLISKFNAHVKDLKIRPLHNKSLSRNLGIEGKNKIGIMVIIGSHTHNGKVTDCLNIPFKLGFDTMDAHFIHQNVLIETLGYEFTLHKLNAREIKTLIS